jgi:hypothetical protein
MQLLAQAPADVADAGDGPICAVRTAAAFAIALTPAARPWRGWRRTNTSSIGGSLNTGEIGAKSRRRHSDDQGRANSLLAQTIRKTMQNCRRLSSTSAGP